MSKDRWDKAEIIVKILSTLFVPIIIVVISIYFNSVIKDKEQAQKEKELKLMEFQKDKEHKQKNMEIAIAILSSKPTTENQPLRDWAISTINKNSEIKLSQAAIKVLKEKSLPRQPSVYKESPFTIIDGGSFLQSDSGDLILTDDGKPITVEGGKTKKP